MSCWRIVSTTCSPTVFIGLSEERGSCGTHAISPPRISVISSSFLSSSSVPFHRIELVSAITPGLSTSWRIDSPVTLLPAPLSPTIPRRSPAATSNETSLTAVTTPPSVWNSVVRFSTHSIDAVCRAQAFTLSCKRPSDRDIPRVARTGHGRHCCWQRTRSHRSCDRYTSRAPARPCSETCFGISPCVFFGQFRDGNPWSVGWSPRRWTPCCWGHHRVDSSWSPARNRGSTTPARSTECRNRPRVRRLRTSPRRVGWATPCWSRRRR